MILFPPVPWTPDVARSNGHMVPAIAEARPQVGIGNWQPNGRAVVYISSKYRMIPAAPVHEQHFMSQTLFSPETQTAPAATRNSGTCLGVGLGVGLGCGTLVGLLFCGGIFAGLFILWKGIKPYSPPPVYEISVQAASASPAAQQALGPPIECGLPTQSYYGDGTASLTYDVSGYYFSGTMTVEATRINGRWVFDQVILKPDSGEPIDLTAESNAVAQ